MNLDLSGKHALVCGSTQGIGKAIAEGLAELGATITLIARNEERLETVRQGLATGHQQTHHYVAADFSEPESLAKKVSAHVASHPAQILINNTGGPPAGPITEATPAAFLSAFNSHLMCNHLLAQAVIPGMKASGYGRIVNIISTSVKQPLSNLGVSNTIRGAVANWAKTMANELGGHQITVNNVLPGATNTQRLQSIIANKAAKSGKTEEEVAKSMQSAIPANRFAAPEEVANAAVFLASPAAAYINGINIPVDGGRTSSL